MTDAQRYRNEFARRSFLEIADYDYIAARLLFKNHCYEQSMITAQQSIEKYLKAILLFQAVKPKDLKKYNHNLEAILDNSSAIESLEITVDTLNFIKALNGVEGLRYLTDSYFLRGNFLKSLDKAVFELRVYCSFGSKPFVPWHEIKDVITKYQNGRLVFGGELEKVIKADDSSTHFSAQERFKLKKILFWKNSILTGKIYTTNEMFRSKVAPLDETGVLSSAGEPVDQSMYDAIHEYVRLPKSIRNRFNR